MKDLISTAPHSIRGLVHVETGRFVALPVEIQSILGIPEATQRSWVDRGLVRKQLGRYLDVEDCLVADTSKASTGRPRRKRQRAGFVEAISLYVVGGTVALIVASASMLAGAPKSGPTASWPNAIQQTAAELKK